jgi:hypothetical protein
MGIRECRNTSTLRPLDIHGESLRCSLYRWAPEPIWKGWRDEKFLPDCEVNVILPPRGGFSYFYNVQMNENVSAFTAVQISGGQAS